MKFHSVAIICALATPTVNGFGVARNNVSFARPGSSVFMAKDAVYDFGTLEAKLLAPPAPAPVEEKNVKGKVEKPTPAPPAPQKEKKTKDPKPAPVEKPTPTPAVAPIEIKKEQVVVPKPAPVEKSKPAPAPVEKPKPAPVEKPKPVAQSKPATKDSNALPVGVALGAAPLAVAPFVALSAVRTTLAKTKARRDEIAKEIAEFEAAEAARLAKKQAEVDGGTLGKAIGALGGAAVALGLIITSPFGNMNAPGSLKLEPTASKIKVEKVVQKDTSAKKVESAPASAISKPKVNTNTIGAKKSSSKVDGYDLSIDPAVLDAKPAAKPAATAPVPPPKPVAEKKVVEEKVAAPAAKEAEAKAAAEKKAAEEKAAAAAKEAEAKAAAEKKAAEDKAAAAAAEKKADVSTESAVGVVKGGESGGRVLPKEEISAETLDFLKKYKQ